MMKNKTFPTLLVLTGLVIMTSCNSVKEPELKGVGNIRMDKLNQAKSSVSLDLHYFNPNNYRLKLKKAEGNAWLNGQLLGHFTVDTLVHIAALADFRLPVKMQMDMKHMPQNASAILLGKEVTIKVEAVARVGKGPFYINYPIHYEEKQKLEDLLK